MGFSYFDSMQASPQANAGGLRLMEQSGRDHLASATPEAVGIWSLPDKERQYRALVEGKNATVASYT